MNTTKKITFTAIFAAIATVLMYFEFPLPFMPPFLKVDLSGAVVLIAAFTLGIAPSIAVIVIKDLIHLMSSTTGGSGELADFLMLTALVLVTISVSNASKAKGSQTLGMIAGTIVMSIIAMFTNKFLIIPFYSLVMPIDAIISACAAVNPLIGSMNTYLLIGVLPFNLIKGAILGVITTIMVRRLSKTEYKTIMSN